MSDPIEELSKHPKQAAPAPLQAARLLRQHRFDGLVHWQGVFYAWSRGAYTERADDTLRAICYQFLDERGEKPKRARVSDVFDALKAIAHLERDVQPPCWLKQGRPRSPLAVANGLLDLECLQLHDASADYFTLAALPVAYQADIGDPVDWLAFLESLWPEDPESIDALQEIFGYLLTGWTELQKIFLIIGPKRSGKGTIFRVLKALLGTHNVAAPTLGGLGKDFGMQQLIGKLSGLISDARLGGRADQHAIAERLLSISGEDAVSVSRKYLPDFVGQLEARFFIATNEVPRLADASGALASRFIVLLLSESFYGREDHQLTDKLLSDLPAILNWALEGRRRLQERGRFQQPIAGAEVLEELEELSAPLKAFVRAKCSVHPDLSIRTDDLYRAYQLWCEDELGSRFALNAAMFGRDLHSAFPSVRKTRPRLGESRATVYQGIGLEEQK